MVDGGSSDEFVKTGGQSSVSLFLSLFLLVLAFFIMLVSISTIEETKSNQVMDSLTSAFSELLTPRTEPTQFVSKHGDVLQPDAFQAELTDVFTTAVSVAKVDVVVPGRDMRVDLLAREIFEPDSNELRLSRLPLIDRTVASLNRNPPGIRFQVLISLAVEDPALDLSTADAKAVLAQAGAISRLLIERGSPADSVSAGIYRGEPGGMRFDFHIRREDELVTDFSAATRLEFQPPSITDTGGSQ